MMKYVVIFLIGFWLAKLDSKYGAEFGHTLGTKAREVFGMPPLGDSYD